MLASDNVVRDASRTGKSPLLAANLPRAEPRIAGIYIRVAAREPLSRGNLLPEGERKERRERELLTKSVRPYTKCTISPRSVTEEEKNDGGIEPRRRRRYYTN